MKKRLSEKPWFPFWADKWIFGSMRLECTIEERAIWIDLLALASKDDGYIRANEEIPYLLRQLAGIFNIPEETLKSAIEKFIKIGKLAQSNTGVLYITTWDKYQLSESYNRVQKHRKKKKKEKTLHCNGRNDSDTNKKNNKNKDIKKKNKIKKHKEDIAHVILYLNEKTGKNFKADSLNYISGRLNDGYTVEDCKKVIDIKTAQWLNDPENNKWLRPLTLFRPSNFEGYLNEKSS
ncbi:unnamed protein product, partial [marine sediment metagenome]